MPRYDYGCKACDLVVEEVQGYDVSAVPCPSCGEPAQRIPVYEYQIIQGETVAKGITRASRAGDIKNKHGKYRVSLWQEAQAEAYHAREKAEAPHPDLYRKAKQKAKALGG